MVALCPHICARRKSGAEATRIAHGCHIFLIRLFLLRTRCGITVLGVVSTDGATRLGGGPSQAAGITCLFDEEPATCILMQGGGGFPVWQPRANLGLDSLISRAQT